MNEEKIVKLLGIASRPVRHHYVQRDWAGETHPNQANCP